MTKNLFPSLAAISAIFILGGCTLETGIGGEIIEPDTMLLQPVAITAGSQTFNGEQDGFSRFGTEIRGQDAQGTALDGQALTQLGLKGSAFVSMVSASERVLVGGDLVGATFRTVTRSMEPVDIRIEALEARPATIPEKIIHRYTIAFSLVQEPGWTYACGVNSAGVPITAIPLEELWDYGQGVPGGGSKLHAPGWITFACEGFALAKCVDLGYLPWNIGEGTGADSYHLACTRALRADYCGDGLPQSTDDRLINVYDSAGIQPPPRPSLGGLRIEAEWTASGARCVRRSRNSPGFIPECYFSLPSKVCGAPTHWDSTLLVSELP